MDETPQRAEGPAAAHARIATSLVRPVRVIRRVGLNLLPFFDERNPAPPAPNMIWLWALRRFARNVVWLLPGYAVLFGLVTARGDDLRRSTSLATGGSLRALGLVLATWLGLLALLALTSLLATNRSRGTATAALLLALFGALLMPLAYAAGPGYARALAFVGGTVFSLGWGLAGLAVARSQVFGASDGVLMMIAAPLLGVGGLIVAALQTVGALLLLAAGVGVAWKAGRLLPRTEAPLLTEPTDGAPA
ncbi:hypothetical protein [Plantactinospora sp. GCM10030261]|uniref:hypothetical protein n=1 Tax=Plantactinospora sp. GCM10030261 TaxID=3273420 RepID=UPI00360B6777